MSFGEPGHANSKTAVVRMRPGLIESANEFDQIDRMLERVPRFIVSNSCRRIASKRENIYNGRLGVAPQARYDLLCVMTHTGEVRHRVELCCLCIALHKVVC